VETIGFIGLGLMGKPMAKNLVKAGYPVIVHSRSRGPVKELEDFGAQSAQGSAEVALQSDVVITMLPDSPDVELVVLGAGGVLEGARKGSVIIDMSTISPSVSMNIAQQAAKKGVEALDAPVSGGDIGAKEGTLTIMVGGKKEVFDRCLPIFEVLGGKMVHMGPNGAGQSVKLVNQVIIGIFLSAVSEGLVLGAKAGLDPQKILEVVGSGVCRSAVLELKGPTILDGDFKPGFFVKLHQKDLGLALQAAKELCVPLPVTGLIHEMFNALKARGREKDDNSALITLYEDLAGVEVRRQK
jgi:2-hydroxy-3-oxopropionate reductase